MSLSSASGKMRGQLEPTAALVATAAVCLSLGLYAVALGDVTPTADRDRAEPTLDRVESELTAGGVVTPARRQSALDAAPTGYRTNLTIQAANRQWNAGPAVPRDADRARRRCSVRVDDNRVRAGTVQVAVWT
jgi:hypothetical protein